MVAFAIPPASTFIAETDTSVLPVRCQMGPPPQCTAREGTGGDLEQWAATADIGVLSDHEAMLIRGFLCRAS